MPVRRNLTFTDIASFFDQDCKSNGQFFFDFKKCKWINLLPFLCFIGRFLTSLLFRSEIKRRANFKLYFIEISPTDVGYEMFWSQRLRHKHPSEAPVIKKSYHQHLCSRLFRYYIYGSGPLNLTFFCVLSIRSISLSSIWAFYVCFS